MLRTLSIRRTLAIVATSGLVAALLTIGPAATPASAGPSSYHIEGGGFGHGVGMSQYGARGYADVGYSYQDILKAYYSGVAVSPITQPATLRIWLGEDTTQRVDATLSPSGPANFVIAGTTVATAASGETVRIEVFNRKFDIYFNRSTASRSRAAAPTTSMSCTAATRSASTRPDIATSTARSSSR